MFSDLFFSLVKTAFEELFPYAIDGLLHDYWFVDPLVGRSPFASTHCMGPNWNESLVVSWICYFVLRNIGTYFLVRGDRANRDHKDLGLYLFHTHMCCPLQLFLDGREDIYSANNRWSPDPMGRSLLPPQLNFGRYFSETPIASSTNPQPGVFNFCGWRNAGRNGHFYGIVF